MTNLLATQNSQPSTLTRQIGELREKLARASDDAVTARILFLTRSGLKFPAEMDATKAAQIYAFALKGCALEALKTVCERIVQGRVESIRSFMPTAPELAALVRAEGAVLAADLARATATLDALKPSDEAPKVDEAARARIRAKLQDFRMNHKQQKQEENAGGKIVLDHERAERMKAIMAMPDAREPTQEVLAYRRIIETALPDAAPPPSEPVDGAYFRAQQQQEEMENGESSQVGNQGDNYRDDSGRSEGQPERPFGFEDD